jgi:VCBS repeat-containing protein
VVAIAVVASTLSAGAGDSVSARKRSSADLVQSFQNLSPLGIGGGDAAPAVSTTIEVSGFTAPVADVNVNLIGIDFGPASSQDMDILLIGPEGRTAMLLSDAGGNAAAANVTLVLDDQQPDHLPNGSALTNGFFQPTNFGVPDTFQLANGDALTPPSGSSLGVFNGIDPNGTWLLLTFDDDSNGSVGGLDGWRLTITSDNGVPTTEPEQFQVKAGKALSVPAAGVLANDSDPDNDTLTAILAGQAKKGKVNLQPDGSFTYKANKKAKGTDSFTYLAEDPTGLTALETVTIQIKGKKKGKR